MAPAAESQEALAEGSLCFAGEKHQLGWPPDWFATKPTLLWRYNLHYFEWLWDLPPEGREEAVLDWIERYPLKRGAAGWDPYPISLRLQNWILCLFWSEGTLSEKGRSRIWASLWRQARRLEERLEFHLRANHLLENVASLALLGATFEGAEGTRWKKRGEQLLERELAEQMGADGMHFERSPMYHARVLWLLDVLRRCPDAQIASLAESPHLRARSALRHLRHPDASLALFNDAGHGIYSLPAPATGVPGSWSLPDAGYYGFRSKDGDYLVCDAGELGPAYQPGHGHADCLSFELSIRGHRVITDTGVSDYGVTATRSYVRSTAAHNTVEIDGQDQAELWGAFRVGRRGLPQDISWEPGDEDMVLSASHDGYQRLGVTHWREFSWRARSLKVTDAVSGRACRAVSRLHFAPGVEVSVEGENQLVVRWDSGALRVQAQGIGRWQLSTSPFYDDFGRGEDRACAAYELESPGALRWSMILTW